jgi:hypothetical protein
MLQATGSTMVNTPSTGDKPQTAATFDVSLVIPCPNKPPFILHTLEVVESQLLVPQGFHSLIGRDVLKHCHLTYDGQTRLFTLGY